MLSTLTQAGSSDWVSHANHRCQVTGHIPPTDGVTALSFLRKWAVLLRLPHMCLTMLRKRCPPAHERGARELTFKGPIDMGGSKRTLKEGASGDNSHSLVYLVNDGHQAGLLLDPDLRRQETSLPARALCPLPLVQGPLHNHLAWSPPCRCPVHEKSCWVSPPSPPIKIFFLFKISNTYWWCNI